LIAEESCTMLGLLITLIAGGLCGWFSFKEWGAVWGSVCAVLGFLLSWMILGLILRRVLMKRQNKIQMIMQEAQMKINRQMEMFQRRPPSSMNAAREIVEKIQFSAVRRCLEEIETFKSLYKWNLMLPRQINAMKIQLHYQLKEYKTVDELLGKALLMDPQTVGIAMARMYRRNDEKLDSFYKRNARKFRGESGAFLACVYGWMKVKQNDAEKALKALNNAKKLSDHPVLLANIENLVNGKVKHYSNAGFNDMWYALALEEPKMKPQKQRQMGRGF